ncbi:MAG: hypothetical protein H6812_12125 [Phycisphaeraceae bacterium]|nr:hypothetical protein [Phycisphaeraceae bacterium]
MTKKQPTRRRAGWKRRTAVWVVVCAVLGLATTVGVAWFGAWDFQQWDQVFDRGEFRIESVVDDDPEGVSGFWSIHSNDLAIAVGGQFSRPQAVFSEQNTHERRAGSDIDSEDRAMADKDGADDSEDAHESGYSEFELPEVPELHHIPHGKEIWGELTWGENPRFTMEELPPTSRPEFENILRLEIAAGWPRLALWCQRERVGSLSGRTESWRGAYARERKSPTIGQNLPRILTFPFFPIWRGLLIDTAFWGAVWFVLLWPTGLVAAKAKRARRRAKGKCPWCKYDLRGIENALCPECGGERQPTPRP